MIPIARPDIGEDEVSAVSDVLRSGMLAQGKRVAELEAGVLYYEKLIRNYFEQAAAR